MIDAGKTCARFAHSRRSGCHGIRDLPSPARARQQYWTWEPDEPVAMHVHDKDSIEVFFGGQLLPRGNDGHWETKAFQFADARFVPGGRIGSGHAVSGSPRAVVLELK